MAFEVDPTQTADCPFCGLPIERPEETGPRRPGDMPLGTCPCGAVYAYDATGHNLGAAFIEALVFACNGDWDLAWGLSPEDDYLEKIVENYDAGTNRLVPGGFLAGRRIPGALYFIRMHDDIREVTQAGASKEPAREKTAPPAPAGPGHSGLTRRDVERLVREYRVESLLAHPGQVRKTVRDVQRLLYSAEVLLRLRAADVLGRLAEKTAPGDPEAFAGFLKQLLDSPEDPGSFSPAALLAAGEIIAGAPGIYAGFVPLLLQYLDHDRLRPQVMFALGKIAAARPLLLRKYTGRLLPFLRDPAAETRAGTALALGRLRVAEAAEGLNRLLDDDSEVDYYEDGTLGKKTVGQMAAAALTML